MANSGTSVAATINITDKFGTKYTGTAPATGFTGDLSKFGFNADMSAIDKSHGMSQNDISWDFGDGNTALGLSASHVYNFPGEYFVTCTFFDKDGDPHPNISSRAVNVYNYFTDEIIWRTDNIMSSLTETVTAGRLSNPLTIERYNNWQSYNALSATGYTINVYASGSDSNYVDQTQYVTDKNIHFQKTWRFVENGQRLTPLSSISTTDNLLYFKTISAPIAGGSLVPAISSDPGAIFTGTSGSATVYYIDDSPRSQVNLFADLNTGNFPTFINNTFNIPREYFINLDIDYFRSKPSVLPVVIEKNIPTHLLITSTGIPGFSISRNKFEKTPIAYTISVADKDNNLVKHFPGLSAGCESTYYRIEHNFAKTPFNHTTYYSNSSITFQQYGALSLFAIVTGDTLNEYITASMVVPDDNGGIIPLTGQSNTFNVWPASGRYHAEKHGENYDFSETLKSYILQDTISEKSNFVNWFMTEIFGTKLSDSESFGKTIYEKIEEMPHNMSDIDVANVDALYSMAKMVNLNFDDYRYNFPAGIKRLIDLLSINQSRLFGFMDNSNMDFDKSGYTSNDTTTYGKNLGVLLDTSTYIVSAGTPIIANQLFGNQLKYINTMVVSGSELSDRYSTEYNGLTSYLLNSYDESWGWGLSVPAGESINKYYDFYSYVDNADIGVSSFGIVNSVIDFSSAQTTLDANDNVVANWSSQYGIIDNMFDHRLREGLKLFNPDASTFIEVTSGTDGDDCSMIAPTPPTTPTNTPTPTKPEIPPTPSVTPTQTSTPAATPPSTPASTPAATPGGTPAATPPSTPAATPASTPGGTPPVTPPVTPTPSVTPSVTSSVTPTPSVTPSTTIPLIPAWYDISFRESGTAVRWQPYSDTTYPYYRACHRPYGWGAGGSPTGSDQKMVNYIDAQSIHMTRNDDNNLMIAVGAGGSSANSWSGYIGHVNEGGPGWQETGTVGVIEVVNDVLTLVPVTQSEFTSPGIHIKTKFADSGNLLFVSMAHTSGPQSIPSELTTWHSDVTTYGFTLWDSSHYEDDSKAYWSGAVQVYKRNSSGTYEPITCEEYNGKPYNYLRRSHSGHDRYGWDIDTSANGDVVIVSAPHWAYSDYYRPGAWFIYEKTTATIGPGTDRWENTFTQIGPHPDTAEAHWQQPFWFNDDSVTLTTEQFLSQASTYTGHAVGMNAAGTRVAVGSPAIVQNRPGVSDCGVVEIYDKVGGIWTRTASLSSPAGMSTDFPVSEETFGCSLAMSDDGMTIVVGSATPFDYTGTSSMTYMRNGNGWIFEFISGEWTPVFIDRPTTGVIMRHWHDPIRPNKLEEDETDNFGMNVDISGDGTLVIVSGCNDIQIYEKDQSTGKWHAKQQQLPSSLDYHYDCLDFTARSLSETYSTTEPWDGKRDDIVAWNWGRWNAGQVSTVYKDAFGEWMCYGTGSSWQYSSSSHDSRNIRLRKWTDQQPPMPPGATW